MNENIHIFCDFDGTISMNDMIGQIMMHFVPHEARPIIKQIQEQKLSVKNGVEALFQLIPSENFQDITDFAIKTTKIRPGFEDFVKFASAQGWHFSLVSGGFHFFVDPVVASIRDLIDVYCNCLDTSTSHLGVIWGYPCESPCTGGCGLCKPTIMRNPCHDTSYKIVIGDGVTDLKAARIADHVFARSKLASLLQAEGIPYDPYETFFDIMETMRSKYPGTENRK